VVLGYTHHKDNTQRKLWVEIDQKALVANIHLLKKTFKTTAIMAIVKSNAYGHGLVEVCQILFDLQLPWYGICDYDEAQVLCDLGCPGKILVLGPLHPAELSDIAHHIPKATVCLSSEDLIDAWLALKQPQQAFIKCDTGMSRLGISPHRFQTVLQKIKASPHRSLIRGIMTHYANTPSPPDHPDLPIKKQLAIYKTCISQYLSQGFTMDLCHGGASHPALLYKKARGDIVRLGGPIYGFFSTAESQRRLPDLHLQPVLSWKTRIVQIKDLHKGAQVGYGSTYTAKEDITMAVLPLGYWHGYFRKMGSNQESYVLIDDHKCPIIGSVSMTMMTVKLPRKSGFFIGQEVILLGKSPHHCLSATVLAGWQETIPYEITTSIHPSIKRIVV